MDFELLSIFGDNGRIEEDRENSAKQLIVDLYPLDAKFISDVRCRIRILCRQTTEGSIDEFLHTLVDDRHSDPF